MPNRLIKEKSPYLLQHAHNPVDWFAWGEEAFEKSKKEDKPIFLSIGYSTCHWCHVMEEESFVNLNIAKILNQHFVPIKVDREERPDVDQIYMQAVMAIAGSGGWPMSVFLTPDLEPFYGGTYFPPEDRWGRPGFATLLTTIAQKWQAERDTLTRSGKELTEALKAHAARSAPPAEKPVSEETLAKGFQQFWSQYDATYAGFGSAPKFPRSHSLSWLLRYWKRQGSPEALDVVEATLEAMARGGMYDALGGGFHRYSVDAEWHVPHFEKMLYDQALLSKTYLEAYQAFAKEPYERVAREILDYVLRDMTSPEGGFYCAEDADSASDSEHLHKKTEGAFYVWTEEEIIQILGAPQAKSFNAYYDVKPNGNVTADPQGEFKGKNILRILCPDSRIEENLREAREKLFAARKKRPRPHRDDKILTDWNGLMISSFAYASRVLNEPRYLLAAKRAADFILSRMKRPDGRFLHRFCDGEAAIPGFLEDYAFLIHGLVDLYEASFDAKYLAAADFIAGEMVRLFQDDSEKLGGGFWLSGHDGEKLIAGSKELYDGAIPSGNSVAVLSLIRSARLTGNHEYEKVARRTIEAFASVIEQFPSGFPQMLIAVEFLIGPSQEIVIEGEGEGTHEFARAIFKQFLPNKVVSLRSGSGKPKVLICNNSVCKPPITDITELRKVLL